MSEMEEGVEVEGSDTVAMEGYSVRPDSAIGGDASTNKSPVDSFAYLDEETTAADEADQHQEEAESNRDQHQEEEDDEDDDELHHDPDAILYHFGPTNPLGPIPVSIPIPGNNKRNKHNSKKHRTTKSISTEQSPNGKSYVETTIWTTVLSEGGMAYRTTRVVGISDRGRASTKKMGSRSKKGDDRSKGDNKGQLLTTTYERSVPLGTTQRIIQTYSTDGKSYDRTTELVRPGGSTTVRHQKYALAAATNGGENGGENGGGGEVWVRVGREEIMEYPPMEIVPKIGWDRTSGGGSNPNSPLGGGGGGGPNSGRNNAALTGGAAPGGAAGSPSDAVTIVSELTNPRMPGRPIDVDENHTLAGNTYRCDDPTLDPTFVDYNAGYSEEMARKHGSSSSSGTGGSPPASPMSSKSRKSKNGMTMNNGMNGSGGINGSRRPGSNWSLGTEQYSYPPGGGGGGGGAGGRGNRNGNSSMRRQTDNNKNWSEKRRGRTCFCLPGTMSSKSKLILFATITIIVAIAIGAAVGAVTSRGSGKSTSPTTPSTPGGGTAPTPPSSSSSPPNASPGQRPPSSPPTSTSDVFDKTGFERYWPSEDGWIVAPSFASFVPDIDSDIDDSSYYDAYYLPDLPTCADRCDKIGSVGGAYFDLSSQDDKRNVCLCYKAAECYDPKLVFSGGTVFLREEHFVSPSQMCQMSTCGYFPDDPICDGLDIVDVETLFGVELRKVVGLMEDEDVRIFEQACAEFLNGGFGRMESSPIEGVRCRLLTQDLTGRRRRRRERNLRSTLVAEAATSEAMVSSSVRKLQGDGDTLELYMRVTGMFVPTSEYPDADSVNFGDSVKQLFYREGDDFVQNLAREAEAVGTDYYEEVEDITVIGSAVPVPPVVPNPSPVNPTDEPSPVPTRDPTARPSRMPVSWPTTESPSRRPTRRPTKEPTRSPTKVPTKKPTKAPSPKPTPRPTNQPTPKPIAPAPTPESPSSSIKFCLGSSCWEQVGSALVSERTSDQFGDKVQLDASGTRFSVSASLSSESGFTEAGMVNVYDVEGSDFAQVGQTLYGFEAGDQVRGVLSGSGRRLALYSQRRDDDTGRVWIYELQSGEWVEIGRIIGEKEGERFSQSVSLSTDGSIVAVGAPFAYSKRGAVRVYREKGNSWRQMGSDILGIIPNGKFGWDVALAANALMLVIGQKSDDNGNNSGRSGRIRVFQFNGSNANANGSFEQFGNAIQGDNPGDDFGRAVAISASGTIVAGGARYHDGPNGGDSGQVKAFSYFGGGSWLQTPFDGSDIVGDGEEDELMNVSLNARGNRIAAGGGSGDNDIGYVIVFDNTGDGWKQVGGKLTGSNDGQKFGSDISLTPDGTRLLVGSPARDNNKIRTSVQLFELISD